MNVLAGDVAVIIKGRWPNIGRIVYVVHQTEDKDYSSVGYGILPSWLVESLGGELDGTNGPTNRGFTPDISLRKIPDISAEQAAEMRKMKARNDFDAALDDLKKVLADYIEDEALVDSQSGEP